MANDPYAGLAKPIKETSRRDPYAGLGRELTPTKKKIPERSLLEAGVEAVGNIPASAAQYAKGMYEAVTNPIETAGTMLDIMAGGAYKVLPKPVQDFVVSLEDDPAALNRAIKAANQFGGQMAERYGSYDAIKNTLATDPVGFAADISGFMSLQSGLASGAGRMARKRQVAQRTKAMQGGASAASSRSARNWGRAFEDTSRLYGRAAEVTNPMNVMAPAGRGVRKIAERAPPKIANFMSPKSAAYMEAAEGRGPELLQQLRAQGEIVPGSAPTAAQQASPLGLTKFSAMGAASAKAAPSEYYARAAEQDAARMAAVQGVGGTSEDLAALQKGRQLTAQQKYGAIEKKVVPIDDTFRALTQRPSMDKAMRRAAEISAEQGVPFQMGPDVRPGSMAGMATPGRPAEFTVQSLHNLKTAMDDIIKDPATFGIGANEARLMGNTRNQLVKWIESKEPGYKTARETFAQQSRRINQREVGQFLEGKLASVLGGEAPLRATSFAGAVKEAPTTIKRATTGEARFQQLTDLLEPHQVKAVEDIRKDLARAQATETQARKGTAAAPRIAQLASQAGDMPALLNRVATIANAIYNRVQGKIDRKLAMEIAYEMIDPKLAANALEKAMVRENLARATGRGAGAAAGQAGKILQSTPAKIGAQTQNIMTQAENQNAMAMAQYPKVNEQGAPLVGIGRVTDEQGNVFTYPEYGVAPKRKR